MMPKKELSGQENFYVNLYREMTAMLSALQKKLIFKQCSKRKPL
jgi:hypothetical protein